MAEIATEKTNTADSNNIDLFIVKYLTFIPFLQKMLFVENLKVLIQAGISVMDALKILIKQSVNRKMRMIVTDFTEKVEKGEQLSEAFESHPDFFPNIYVRMVAAGETAGKLEESLGQVEEQMKRSHELASKIKGAMIYPIILIAALLGIGVEMMVYVLPNILSVFEELNAELPLATRILITTSHMVVRWGIFIAFGVLALVVLFVIEYKKAGFKKFVHKIILRLPIIGKVTKKINLARFAGTLHNLLKSGIPIIEAFKITADVIPNLPYKYVVLDAAEKIKTGNEIAPLLEQHPELFPPMVSQMIGVGEKSGNTESMLQELSTFLTENVDSILKNITTVIEPIIILFLGVVVAFMAMAVIMPLYNLAQNI